MAIFDWRPATRSKWLQRGGQSAPSRSLGRSRERRAVPAPDESLAGPARTFTLRPADRALGTNCRPFICSRRRPRRVLSLQLSRPRLVTRPKLVVGAPLLLRTAVPPVAARGFCGGRDVRADHHGNHSVICTVGSSVTAKKSCHFGSEKCFVSRSPKVTEKSRRDASIGPASLCGAAESELFIASPILDSGPAYWPPRARKTARRYKKANETGR